MQRSGTPEDGSVEPKGSGEPLGTLICLSLNHLLTHKPLSAAAMYVLLSAHTKAKSDTLVGMM